jgi:hypothetical protein
VLALLQQQPPPPEVTSSVERDRIGVGDEIDLTIRVTSASAEVVQVSLPPLLGFELLGRSERTEVSYGGDQRRVTTVTLRLRAAAKGHYRLGPMQVRQGRHLVQGDPVEVTVDRGSAATARTLPVRMARLLDRAPAPSGSPPAAVTLVLSAASAVVGEQVDVVTIAWFQRDLRQQLRRSPTVDAPRIEGVWSYPQPVPNGIAASRLVGGHWYDLFILHQIVFPLTPGRVTISPARLHYSVPLAFQFFSQEERYALTSQGATLTVTPLPDAGRPADFTGAVARGLTVSESVTPATAQQGEALTASLVLNGEGNVALWPVPAVVWPRGFRAYPDATEDRVRTTEGRLGGTKTFRYLLVPDTAGATLIPPLSYTYFDPDTKAYLTTHADGVRLTVAPRASGALVRATPPALMLDDRPSLARRVRTALPDAVWWTVLLLAPLGFVFRTVRMPRRKAQVKGARSDSLAGLERELSRVVAALAAGKEREGPVALQAALRRSGLTEADAERVIEVRERLRAARFGGAGIDPTVMADARALIQRIRPERARWGPRWRSGTAAAFLLLLAGLMDAQSNAPEQLYDAGALGSAAAGFLARANAAPDVGAHWYNLGAARLRLGMDGSALGAWTRAARLLPRDHTIRRALVLVPPADGASARQLWVSPFTPEELWLIAACAWLAGWAGLAWSRRWRGRWLVLLAGAVILGVSAETLRWWYDRPLAVLATEQPILVSPTERAPRVGTLPKSSTVLVKAERGGWSLVQDPAGHRGWTEDAALVPVSFNP